MNREEEQAELLRQRTEQRFNESLATLAERKDVKLRLSVAMQPEVIAWAFLIRSQYEALMEEDFTAEQAMELLKLSPLHLPSEEGQ